MQKIENQIWYKNVSPDFRVKVTHTYPTAYPSILNRDMIVVYIDEHEITLEYAIPFKEFTQHFTFSGDIAL